ncbi:FAD:protein FMN transferase [Pulveribacter suum]|uniref:FAD:protein FMN transferase n=1 Tax=Pulveribacter suum TaxID=2116657 RepID=A0A2P1NMV0_9BURK|nr:FAD:protein FMN transferase [Pulveribacter suum]AVP58343.1 thiamine biosynthesis protein ApbE [Pulveribacter suum]
MKADLPCTPSPRGQWSRRRFALALPLLAGLPHLAGAAAPAAAGAPPLARQSRELMGTRVDIAVPLSAAMGQQRADQAIERAFSEMQRLEALMSRYRTDSDVARIAAAAGRQPVAVAPEVLAVLRAAQRLHSGSAGAFDPTVGALDGWQFGGSAQAVPAPGEIARALRLVDGRALVLDERAGTAYLPRPGMRLDLGGVAKLPILQAGLQTLAREGMPDALVNGGGDVLVAGSNHGQPWRVGVRDPAAPQQLLGVLALQGRAVVASSGDYERGFMHQGRRLHHVLDPHTGWPTRGVHGVALLAREVDEVNGWGTALMVQGPAKAATWSARHPGVELLVASADGARWTSPGMTARLQPAA